MEKCGGEAKTYSGSLQGRESQGRAGWVYAWSERTKPVKREILMLQQSDSLGGERGWQKGPGVLWEERVFVRILVFWSCFLL